MSKRSEEGEPKEGLSLPRKLLDPMAKAYFGGFWGKTRRAGTPNGNLSPRYTILLRSALSEVSTPAPASKEVSRYQATE
uniref:Uncharacterized protein n=1 Tax=Chenopodium quinoa TaxID=63459 RepID=A0A803MBG3_CHEQI